MSTPTSAIPASLINQDSNNQEYVETCDDWVRVTLVMFEGHPHIRIQEHHEQGSGRLHLGPLIPLDQWFAFKESVDRLVGPYIRQPRTPLGKRTLSYALECAILKLICTLSERHRRHGIGPWYSLLVNQVSESFVPADIEFAFRRLARRGVLNLVKDGHTYSEKSTDRRWFFGSGDFDAVITPEGWSYWESINA